MELSLKEAFRIAVEVHGDQRDKAGEPYLFHVMRVAMAMDTDEERVVAILHDVIEDYDDTMETMADINEAYGQDILSTVELLTRNKPYLDYIRRLSTNPLAVKVKLADLRDNMDGDRLRKLPTKEEAARLYKKYREAYEFLLPIATSALLTPAKSPASGPPEKS